MAHLSLALLGSLQITLDKRPLTTFESDKVRALLIYLAIESERPQRRAMLAEMFWPDQPDRTGRHNLSQALFNLRQTVGDQTAVPPFFHVTRDTVQFNSASNYAVDVAAFDELIATCEAHRHRRLDRCATCAERLLRAVSLYRGDFLAQFSLGDCTAFDEWLLVKRERLGQSAFHALSTLVTYHELRGDYACAQELAQRQLALDPWREIGYRQFMRVLALDGQRNAALAVYERCRQILAEQLDVEPEDETTALYQQIHDNDNNTFSPNQHLTTPATFPNNFPTQLTPFVGREHELVQIGDMLANSQCRLITILGPGGIGKTRLGLQAALDYCEIFPDGLFFVPLVDVHEPTLLVSVIANALDLTLQGPDEPMAQVQGYLQQKEVLLLLDNFEHLLPAAPLLSLLLRAVPKLTLLVTSRQRLDLHGEWLVELEGLAVPGDEHDATLEQSGAGQLWLKTAQRVQSGYKLEEQERSSIARICRMVEGMPLAIELAASWVRMLTSTEIAAELAQGLSLLATSSRDMPERHRSVRAVLDHSWQLLQPAEQHVLCRLAVFRGGFDRDAAEYVSDASFTQLAVLLDKSLLRATTGSPNQRRYELHELVRQYALEQLEAAGEVQQTRDRHVAYCLSLAEQAEPHFTGPEEGNWLRRLEAEHGNIRGALTWALNGGNVATAARICGAIWRFWQVRGYFTEGRQWLAMVLAQVDGGMRGMSTTAAVVTDGLDIGKALQAQLLKGKGVLAWAQSDYVDARASFEASVALYQELDDKDGIAALSSNLGVLALYQGDFEQATTLVQTSLALRRERGDVWGTAACLHNLGAIAGKMGDLALAQQHYEEALPLFRELGHERAVATLLTNLGDVAEVQGNVDRARRFSTESLAIRRKLGDTAGTATALTRIASLALRRNDLVQARTHYMESLTLFQSLGDKEYIAVCLEGFASVAVAGQQWERAVCLWSAADRLRAAINVPVPPSTRAEYEPRLAIIRTQFSEESFAAAWAEGQTMSQEQAIVYALGGTTSQAM